MQRMLIQLSSLAMILLVTALCQQTVAQTVRIERLVDELIIRPSMDEKMGANIAGPIDVASLLEEGRSAAK